jgi:hypothetical protein
LSTIHGQSGVCSLDPPIISNDCFRIFVHILKLCLPGFACVGHISFDFVHVSRDTVGYCKNFVAMLVPSALQISDKQFTRKNNLQLLNILTSLGDASQVIARSIKALSLWRRYVIFHRLFISMEALMSTKYFCRCSNQF